MKISKMRPGWATATAIFGVAALGLGSLSMVPAAADTVPVSPATTIDFESPYATGNINGQYGWSKTGPYDVEVENVADFSAALGYGFGAQALRSSNATTSGSFGDHTFSPGLTAAAGEDTGAPYFTASFKIGTTQATVQTGLHMSVSPDGGTGGRMTYLRFEDQADGVHAWFADATPSGGFTDTDIATLAHGTSHTVKFAVVFVDGPSNDLVKVYLDGVLRRTGTTWEDYYLALGQPVPTTSKLLFRQGGAAVAANAGQGFLIDGVSLSSTVDCADAFSDVETTRTLIADCTTDHTITVPDGWTLDGAGHSITAIDPAGGHFLGAVVANAGRVANVRNLTVTASDLANACDGGADRLRGILFDNAAGSIANNVVTGVRQGLSGCQEGNAIEVRNLEADGVTPASLRRTVTISGNIVSDYQKNGITANGGVNATITGNSVTGDGPIGYTAQNGIQVSRGASGTVKGNTASGNDYTPISYEACGILLYQAAGVKASSNTLFANERDMCNYGKGGAKGKPNAS